MKKLCTYAALTAAAALALSACSGGASNDAAEGGDSAAVITANGAEPQNPLVPANTNENGGGRIVDVIYSGLEYYDAEGSHSSKWQNRLKRKTIKTTQLS